MEDCSVSGSSCPDFVTPLCKSQSSDVWRPSIAFLQFPSHPITLFLFLFRQETNQSFRDYLLKGESAVLKVCI